jgi:hypothetical protein
MEKVQACLSAGAQRRVQIALTMLFCLLLHHSHLITGLDIHEYMVYGEDVATADNQAFEF